MKQGEIIADGSALIYALRNVQYVENLLVDGSCLYSLENWFLLSMEGFSNMQQKSMTRDMILAMGQYKDNCPVILDLKTFAMFLHYIVKEKIEGVEICHTRYEGS